MIQPERLVAKKNENGVVSYTEPFVTIKTEKKEAEVEVKGDKVKKTFDVLTPTEILNDSEHEKGKEAIVKRKAVGVDGELYDLQDLTQTDKNGEEKFTKIEDYRYSKLEKTNAELLKANAELSQNVKDLILLIQKDKAEKENLQSKVEGNENQ